MFLYILLLQTATQISHKVIFLQSKISWMPYCSMVLIFFFIFFFASGPGMIITLLFIYLFFIFESKMLILLQRIQSSLCYCLSAGVTAPLPGEIFTQSFKSAGYTIACTLNWTGLFVLGMLFPVLVVSTFLLVKYGIFLNAGQWTHRRECCVIDVQNASFPGETGLLLFSFIPVFLCRLWTVCEVQRP